MNEERFLYYCTVTYFLFKTMLIHNVVKFIFDVILRENHAFNSVTHNYTPTLCSVHVHVQIYKYLVRVQ